MSVLSMFAALTVAVPVIVAIVVFAADWLVYRKMGREGWESLVPVYNLWALCQSLYGNGWKFLFLLVPIYNIYFVVKMQLDLAKAFGKKVGFGLGLLFLPEFFKVILGFGSAKFNGESDTVEPDLVSKAVERIMKPELKAGRDENALEKIEKLNELKKAGVITEEECAAKVKELMKRI